MQKVLNRTLSLFLVLALAVLCMIPALGAWYDDGMNAFVEKGYITGYGNGDYGPERAMTRAEFIAVVNKVMNYTQADMDAAAKFTDMDSARWYYKPIAIALKAGYVKGNADGTMAPNAIITRQEAVTMLVNIKGLDLKDKDAARKSLEANEAKFQDVDSVPNWAVDYVEAAVEDGIVTGSKEKGGMYLNPKKSLTRAEGVYMIMHLEEEEGIFVLMNVPYSAFYAAEGTESVDAASSATVKAGNYGLAGGSFHSAATAGTEKGEDDLYPAVGGETGAKAEGATWPVKVSDLDALKDLGGKEITDETSIITAEAHHGTTTNATLEGAAALNEAPAYSYYVLKEEPAEYLTMKVSDGKVSFSANKGEVTVVEDANVVVTYGNHWGDVVLGFGQDEEGNTAIPEALNGKQVNAVTITMEDGTEAGLVHLDYIWANFQLGWYVDTVKGLDGKAIESIDYYVNDTKGNYSVVSVRPDVTIDPIYTGEVTAAFDGDESVAVTGLPEDIKNAKATVSLTTGGHGQPVVTTYLTAVDGEEPVLAEIKDGKIALASKPDTAVASYQVTVYSDNYAPIFASAATPGYVAPETSGTDAH